MCPRKPRINRINTARMPGTSSSSSPSVRTVRNRESAELVHELAPPARYRIAHAVLHVGRVHVRASQPGPRPDPRPPREPHHMTRCRNEKNASVSCEPSVTYGCRPRTAVPRENLCQGRVLYRQCYIVFLMCRTSCDGRFFLPVPLELLMVRRIP